MKNRKKEMSVKADAMIGHFNKRATVVKSFLIFLFITQSPVLSIR
jgi:hypothetical protein